VEGHVIFLNHLDQRLDGLFKLIAYWLPRQCLFPKRIFFRELQSFFNWLVHQVVVEGYTTSCSGNVYRNTFRYVLQVSGCWGHLQTLERLLYSSGEDSFLCILAVIQQVCGCYRLIHGLPYWQHLFLFIADRSFSASAENMDSLTRAYQRHPSSRLLDLRPSWGWTAVDRVVCILPPPRLFFFWFSCILVEYGIGCCFFCRFVRAKTVLPPQIMLFVKFFSLEV